MSCLQQVINGVSLGAMYALLALGFTMVYGIIELINFAHFNVFMVGSFFAMWVLRLHGHGRPGRIRCTGLPLIAVLLLALVGTMLFSGVLGVLIERIVLRPLRNVPGTAAMITTIGVSYILFNIILLAPAPTSKNYPNPMPAVAGRSAARCCGCARSWSGPSHSALMLGPQFLRAPHPMGKAMQATAQDQEARGMMGVDVDRVVMITFFLGSALAGAAGLIFGLYYNYTSFIIGYTAGLRAFTAAVLGGIGNIPGAMLGGILIGSDRVARRPVHRGALDRRHHLLDPGARAGVQPDRDARPRRAKPVLTR